MTDSSLPLPGAAPRDSGCLGRTCLHWQEDGELSTIDLAMVLSRLAEVDDELIKTSEQPQQFLPSHSNWLSGTNRGWLSPLHCIKYKAVTHVATSQSVNGFIDPIHW